MADVGRCAEAQKNGRGLWPPSAQPSGPTKVRSTTTKTKGVVRDTVHIKHFRELRKRAVWSPVWSQVVADLRVCIRQRSRREPMNDEVQHKLGTHVPIFSKAMKGWLFMQGWLVSAVDRLLHPLRWTSISKGQVWNPPPRGNVEATTSWTYRPPSSRTSSVTNFMGSTATSNLTL